MKFNDVKGLSLLELQKKKREINEELFQAKMKNSLGQLGNALSIKVLRRDRARIETAINTKMKSL